MSFGFLKKEKTKKVMEFFLRFYNNTFKKFDFRYHKKKTVILKNFILI